MRHKKTPSSEETGDDCFNPRSTFIQTMDVLAGNLETRTKTVKEDHVRVIYSWRSFKTNSLTSFKLDYKKKFKDMIKEEKSHKIDVKCKEDPQNLVFLDQTTER